MVYLSKEILEIRSERIWEDFWVMMVMMESEKWVEEERKAMVLVLNLLFIFY